MNNKRLIKIFQEDPIARKLLNELVEHSESYYIDLDNIVDHLDLDFRDNLGMVLEDIHTELEYLSYGGGLDNFEIELAQFIKNHKYTKAHNAWVGVKEGVIELHTVNGEYERLEIVIKHIS